MGDTDPVAALLDPAPTATEAPVTTEPASTETTPAGGTESQKPEAPAAPAEPDYDSLLANEEVVNKLLQHKKAQERIKSVRDADIERRSQERAAEIVRQNAAQAKKEAEAQLRRAEEERNDVELERIIGRILNDDPTDPEALRQQASLEARKTARQAETAQEAALERLIPQVMPGLQERAMTEAGRYWMGVLDGYVKEAEGLTDEQRSGFDPRDQKWASPLDFVKAINQASAKALAEAEIKRRLPLEVEAEITKRNGEQRQKEVSPVVLPPGGKSDGEFLSAYSGGANNDHARALKHLRDLGLQI